MKFYFLTEKCILDDESGYSAYAADYIATEKDLCDFFQGCVDTYHFFENAVVDKANKLLREYDSVEITKDIDDYMHDVSYMCGKFAEHNLPYDIVMDNGVYTVKCVCPRKGHTFTEVLPLENGRFKLDASWMLNRLAEPYYRLFRRRLADDTYEFSFYTVPCYTFTSDGYKSKLEDWYEDEDLVELYPKAVENIKPERFRELAVQYFEPIAKHFYENYYKDNVEKGERL